MRVEARPHLLRTISGTRPELEPICLCQGDCLARFYLRRKARQGDDRRPQEAKYCQGCERFDHVRLLTVAVSRSRRARGSIHNRLRAKEFRLTQLIFEIVRGRTPPQLGASRKCPSTAIFPGPFAALFQPKVERELYCVGAVCPPADVRWHRLKCELEKIR